MSRWYWKRTVLAVVMGTGMATSAFAADMPTTGYKPNDVITIKMDGKEQKLTVVSSQRLQDGRVATVVKDGAGEKFTLTDKEPNGSLDTPSGILPVGVKDYLAPKSKGTETPAPASNATAAASDSKRWRLLGGKSEKSETPAQPATPPPAAEKKPSLFSRMFSKNKNETPAQQPQAKPAAQAQGSPRQPANAPPAPMPAVQSAPFATGTPTPGTDLGPWSQVRSPNNGTPPVTVTAPPAVKIPTAPTVTAPSVVTAPPVPTPTTAKPPVPGVTTGTTRINLTPEPQTARPTVVTPPVPVAPERQLSPAIPMIPTPTPGLPSIPVPSFPIPSPTQIPSPGPQSRMKPAVDSGIRTVSHTRTIVTVEGGPLDELKPQVKTLMQGATISERQMAARILAGGHYGWRPEVKDILLSAAKNDPSPSVRICCIEQLCQLGCCEPKFLNFLAECAQDDCGAFRIAAAKALKKMKPVQ